MPPRRPLLALALVLATAACTRVPSTAVASARTAAPSSAARSPSAASSPAAEPSSMTVAPSGLASPFGEDVAAGDVPLRDLIPEGTTPAGSWFANTSEGDAILVAWQAPGSDPFRTDRGVVVWRYTGEPTLWRPVFAATYPAKRDPVLGITATIADVTGDGSDDALVFAESGGSGACGTYLVIDASAGEETYRRSVCDTTIEPSADPPGLDVTESVYAHGDPHCCPSAIRTTVLRWDADGSWATVSETSSPT